MIINRKIDFFCVNVIKKTIKNNFTLFFEHDAQNECCQLALTEKGIRASKTFKLSNLLS